MKKCSKCRKLKQDTEFYRYTGKCAHQAGKLHARCKRCQHDARAKHRSENPVMAAKTARKHKIKRLFGITPEQYDAVSEKQGGVCAICQRVSPDGRRLHIDHCHKLRKVRGLLCHDCNRGLGMFRDSIALLNRAVEFLTNPTAKGICD